MSRIRGKLATKKSAKMTTQLTQQLVPIDIDQVVSNTFVVVAEQLDRVGLLDEKREKRA
jgi:hypothetical protein